MFPDYRVELNQEIEALERQRLDLLTPASLDLAAMLNGLEFIRLKGIGKFWETEQNDLFLQHSTDLVTAAHSYGHYFTFVLTGNPHAVELYFAAKDATTIHSLLKGNLPHASLTDSPVRDLGVKLRSRCGSIGLISGVPSLTEGNTNGQSAPPAGAFHFERVVRGMRDANWVYVVHAYPRSEDVVVESRQELLDKIADFASKSKRQQQQSAQATQSPTDHSSATISKVDSWELVNRRAEYAVELLEAEVKRVVEARGIGQWQVGVYFAAATPESAGRLAALLKGVLAGPNSVPEPVRAHLCQRYGMEPDHEFHTFLTSKELGFLIQPLHIEMPGYSIHDPASFDLNVDERPNAEMKIGQLDWEGIHSSRSYRLRHADLTKHATVFGVTGSGKTTTILQLLHQCWQGSSRIPFLVIEPAKTEYRALLGTIHDGAAKGLIPNLRVYTLGGDTIAPFRLNPFEFELGEATTGLPVLSHIDFLKAVFNAAFILYAPMPYILETALHEIYEDKGWNLATGTNVRLSEKEWLSRHDYPIFPTLTDLHQKVGAVTRRFGYEPRVEQNVIAGLQGRIGSLRLGAKGLMLDTPRGMSMRELLSLPTVMELERIGNDDEKTFLIGLLLARLYDYRRQQAVEGKLTGALQHILVIEEAHRLLKNVSTQVDVESSNLRAQAVETFANMLAEVRHYGQGVMVSEQIPSKLTPDVIKNTNLKIVHRLVAADDRTLLGGTMNMSDAQVRTITTLAPGEAIVFSEGDDHPFLVHVDNLRDHGQLAMPLDRDLPKIAQQYITVGQYLPVPDFERYGVRRTPFGGPNSIIYQAAWQHLFRPESPHYWAQIIARCVYARHKLPEALDQLNKQIIINPGHLSIAQYPEALIMLVVLGVNHALQERGAELGWSYGQTNELRRDLTEGLVKLVRTGDLKLAGPELDRFVRAYERSLKAMAGPFPGCRHCRFVCAFRQETSRLLSPITQGQVRAILADRMISDRQERMRLVGESLAGNVQRWLGERVAETGPIAFCAGLITSQRLGFDEYEQAEFGDLLSSQLLDE